MEKKISESHFINFNNGVYDLQKHKFKKMQTKNTALMNVDYDYTDKFTEHKKDLIKYLEDLVPIESDRNLLLNCISRGLIEKNNRETCLNIYGDSNSGKTTFISLLAETMGDYLIKIDSNILTKSIKKSLKELLFLKKKRYVTSELNTNDKINTGLYKSLASGEKMYIGRENTLVQIYEPVHTMCIVSNVQMDFNEDIGATRRTKYIKFPKKFETNVEIGKKIKLWKQDFMLLLIENLKINK